MKIFDRRVCILLVSAVVCFVTMLYQWQALVSGAVKNDHQKKSFMLTRHSALTALEETMFLEANYPTFQKLIDNQKPNLRLGSKTAGGTGTQRKVSWIKTLEAAKVQLGVAEMSFELYPYQSIGSNLKNLRIEIGFESIVLQVSLLHEGMLVSLLAHLEEYAPNPFVVTKVSIDRLSHSTNENSTVQLGAEITLRWHLIAVEEARGDIAS